MNPGTTDMQTQTQTKTVTLFAWHDGDATVGLPGDSAEVTLIVASYAAEDIADYVAAAKERVGAAFSALWETHAKVATKAELCSMPL